MNSNQFARQQLNQQQQQQAFMGTGMPQMGNGGPVHGGGAGQQQPFHDSQPNHPQQSHMPPGFPNMGGMPNGNGSPAAVAAAASLQARAPIQGTQAAARQLELINMAQSQQPQNGPVNLNKFAQQQHIQMRDQQQPSFPPGMNQPSPADIFTSPGMSTDSLRRPSPHPSAGMGQGGQPQQGPNGRPGPGGGPLSLAEMTARVGILRPAIAEQESSLVDLTQQLAQIRGSNSPQEAELVRKIKENQSELNKRKDYFNRLMMAVYVPLFHDIDIPY